MRTAHEHDQLSETSGLARLTPTETDLSALAVAVDSPTALTLRPLIRPGDVLAGEYQMEALLGQGGTGVVLSATHLPQQQRVAIKLLLNAMHPEHHARFLHEGRIAARLQGEHVARVLAMKQLPDGTPFMVLELLEGRDLAAVLSQQGPFAIETAVGFILQACEAMAEAHALGIVHRDLKPANLFLTVSPDGEPCIKVLDFGISRSTADGTSTSDRLTHTASVFGSPLYMSPEQMRSARLCDARSDIWSLGIILYELLTGRLPFDAELFSDLVLQVATLPPPLPSSLRPELPTLLESAILQCLEKPPEQRFQDVGQLAYALAPFATDFAQPALSRIEQWLNTAPLQRPGAETRDREIRIRKPSRLYGREQELAELEQALEQACRGSVALALVTGPSGVGKSALVQALRERARASRCIFAPGKFDQHQRGTPYSALVQALRYVVRRRLAAPAEVLDRWKETWQRAAGPNGRILVDLVPELLHVLGEPKPLVGVGPEEAKNRFQQTVQRFVQTLATAEHPLVLIIDDLQWADRSSLSLLKEILTDPGRSHLLMVGVHRDDEVDAPHPLHGLIEAAKSRGLAVVTRTLVPLGEEALGAMVADMLDLPANDVTGLPRLIKEKTDGSPFFVEQFLRMLHEQELLFRDLETGQWRWNTGAIERAGITDNVAALLERRLSDMPPVLQQVLHLAACIGNRFELSLVARLQGQHPEELRARLVEAIHEGLVRYEDDAASEAYTFVHDRVQQAAYGFFPEGRRRAEHLHIGRLLRVEAGAAPRDEQIFTLLNHLVVGADLIDEPRERLAIARLALAAGQRAKAGAAFDAAAGYLRAGAALLGEDGFAADHEHAFALIAERAECEDILGAFAEAEALFDLLLARARSSLERARVHDLRLVHFTKLGKFDLAIGAAREGLGELGLELPELEEDRKAALAAVSAAVLAQLAERPFEELVAAPALTSPAERATAGILSNLTAPAFYSPTLFALIATLQVQLSLTHGCSEASALACVTFANHLATSSPGQRAQAQELRRLAQEIEERSEPNKHRCKFYVFLGLNAHYFEPIRASIPHFERAMDAGLASGDFAFLSYAALDIVLARFVIGEELSALFAESDRHLALMARTRNTFCALFLTSARQMIANLMGLTRSPITINDGVFDEDAFLEELGDAGFVLIATWHHAIKAELLVLHGRYEEALDEALIAESLVVRSTEMHFIIEIYFYGCLSILAMAPALLQEHEATLARLEKKLAACAESFPRSFQHKPLLVAAERARTRGDDLSAAELYDRAITLAEEDAHTQDVALGLSLAGEHYAGRGRARIARTYLQDAHDAYLRWGAVVVAERLRERHPAIFPSGEQDVPHTPPPPSR